MRSAPRYWRAAGRRPADDPVTTTTASAARGATSHFPSFSALRLAHSELLKRQRAEELTADLLDAVRIFAERACATGLVLDSEQERVSAQSLLDYWATQLYRGRIEPPDATLADFDPLAAPELDDSLCPYVGLDAFQENQHDLFFGRSRLIDDWLALLRTESLLAVLGSSGSGKSSLVLGGLVPRLRAGVLPGSQHWRYRVLTPGSDPLMSLVRAARDPGADDVATLKDHCARLRSDDGYLAQLAGATNAVPTVLVIDQFEQVFTLCQDLDARRAFVANLLDMVRPAERLPARNLIVLTMRTDFEARVAEMPELHGLFEHAAVRVTAMNATELREAIDKPAELVGLKFEQGIVDELVKELLGEPAGLPLLQFTLLKLWERRQRNRVTWEKYRELGGARRALGICADELYESLIPEEQVSARRVLLRLARPGEGSETMSNPIQRDELFLASEARDRVERVLNRLIATRLVRLSHGRAAGDDQVELAHEALVRNWERLRDWLDEERITMRRRLRLTAAADLWSAADRDPDLLWRGSQLDEALSHEHLNKIEQAFVDSSAAVRAREARAARRRQQIGIGGLVVALIVISGLAVYGLVQAGEARVQRDGAIIDRDAATKARATAETAATVSATAEAGAIIDRDGATKARATAETAATVSSTAEAGARNAQRAEAELRKDAVSGQLAALARPFLDSQLDLSLLLSLEAVLVRPTPAAQGSLFDGLQRSPRLMTYLHKHTSGVRSVAFSPIAPVLATSGEDSSIILWDVSGTSDPRPIGNPLTGHQAVVESLAFSPNGRILASASDDQTIRLWEVADPSNPRLVGSLTGHRGGVWSLAFSADGENLASAGGDGTIRLWDPANQRQIGEPLTHSDKAVRSVAFRRDGKLLASASDNGTIMLWDVSNMNDPRPVGAPFESQMDQLRCVAFSLDGELLAAGGLDNNIRLWNVSNPATPGAIDPLPSGHQLVRALVFSPDRKLLASSGADWMIKLWDISDVQSIRAVGAPLTGHGAQVWGIAFSADGKRLASASGDRTAILWDVEGAAVAPKLARLSSSLVGHAPKVRSVAFRSDGKVMASGSDDESVILWDTASHQQLGSPLTDDTDQLRSIAFSPNGRLLASAGVDSKIRLWNVSDPTNSRLAGGPLIGHSAVVESVAFSPDSRTLASASSDATVRLWDVTTRQPMAVLPHSGAVFTLAFSPNAALLAWGGLDGSIVLWDVATQKLLPAVPQAGRTTAVRSLAFSADSKLLVSGGDDQRIILWNLDNPQQPVTVAGHTGLVRATFSRTGTLLASGSQDETIRLWDLSDPAHPRPLGSSFSGQVGDVQTLAFQPDGKVLAVGGGGARTNLVFWDLDPSSWHDRACGVAHRNLTPAEQEQFVSPQIQHVPTCPYSP